MRILIADSDPAASRGIAATLRSRGIMVDHADCGDEAHGLLRHFEFDALVLAPRLPAAQRAGHAVRGSLMRASLSGMTAVTHLMPIPGNPPVPGRDCCRAWRPHPHGAANDNVPCVQELIDLARQLAGRRVRQEPEWPADCT